MHVSGTRVLAGSEAWPEGGVSLNKVCCRFISSRLWQVNAMQTAFYFQPCSGERFTDCNVLMPPV